MRITSLSLVIAVPFLIIMAILLPLSLSYDYQYLFPWLILPVLVLTVIYTLRPQIDYWWVKRQKIGLDDPLTKWLIENSKFYNALDKNDKTKFELRASLFMDSKNFVLKAMEEHSIPEQYKLLSIHEALRISWYRNNYLFSNYDRIIIYPNKFPTPKYKFLHPVEVHREDGIILMSQTHLINGFLKPMNYFNIGLYTWIIAFIYDQPELQYPNVESYQLKELDQVFPYSTSKIQELLGENLLNKLALHIHAFFDFPKEYSQIFPTLASNLLTILNERVPK